MMNFLNCKLFLLNTLLSSLIGLIPLQEPSPEPLQDPTKPSLSVLQSNLVLDETIEKNENEELLLQSIFSKKSGYIAIVSGQLVKMGGKVQGFTVSQISPESITLKKGQIIKTLRLHQNDIKKN